MQGWESELMERTVVRGWMTKWLNWLHWYHSVALNPSVAITDLLEFPIVERSWKRRPVDQKIQRFGLTWRLYERARKGLDSTH